MKYLNFILTSCNKMPIYTFSFLTTSSEKKIKRIDPRVVTNPETLPRVTRVQLRSLRLDCQMAPPISRRLEVEWSSPRIACSVIESTWRLHMASIHFDTRFLLLHRSVEFFRVSLAFYSTSRHSCNRPHRIRIYKRLEIGLLSLLVIRNVANTRSSYKFVRARVCLDRISYLKRATLEPGDVA